ncbi:MAG TPA: bifunctional 3,4-dihydroxy-2-butanone-4-phosphate synthase/GTP cyclohydrolase II [Nitriliruptorales bacterium]|nr:bifunctional 3,4-dihydroxy-2-butanone-4-phosphate synthase/GTP cyclohydrolase II [Nitriliruptorales bacterium]
MFASMEDALAVIRDGGMVVVVDDADRENEGDLVMAGDRVTPEAIAFMVRHTSGVICTPLLGERLDELEIPLMVHENTEAHRTAFTVSVDAMEGITTGISAADRARTIRTLIDPSTRPGDLARPGHIFPLRYQQGGVLRRPGHTEAAVDLARLAGLYPAGVICELVNDDGTMARLPQLADFAEEHGLPVISIADLIAYRRRRERLVRRLVGTRLPSPYGTWQVIGYESLVDGIHHVALVHGDAEGSPDVLVRMHSECLTGDVFRSQRCDCGAQLDLAMARIAAEGRGVIVYLRGHEGRGIGLIHKLQAYQLQDDGHDTVEANLALGFPADARDYGTGASILADLGLTTLRLLTNNPAKRAGLEGFGLRIVERVPLQVRSNPANAYYLRTKQTKLGHVFTVGTAGQVASTGVGDLARQAEVVHHGLAFAPVESWEPTGEEAVS